MKRVITFAIAVLLITMLFASCAAGSKTANTAVRDEYYNPPMAEYVTASSPGAAPPAPSAAPDSARAVENLPSDGSLTSGVIGATISGDKIIYNFNAHIETTEFDDTIKNLNMLIGKFGAFVENSYLSGNSYGNTTFRTANYTIRVPVNNFKGMTDSLSLLGNVFNASTTSQNITAQFIDTQSRLQAYRTEESRLLAMLEKAETVTDMIAIESRLSDVRYQIESLTSTLQNWQNQVDFSTVTLYISEVAELTEQKPVQRSYWEKMGDGFKATLNGIAAFFKGLFMAVVVAFPVLLIIAVIAAVIIAVIRITRKRARAKSNQNNDLSQK
jgi:hypothetical protein